AWFGRGNASLILNRCDDALTAYQKALALKPDCYQAMFQLAAVHERLGDLDEAIACYDRALAIKPDFADGISNRIHALDFAADTDFEVQHDARRVWWEEIGAKIAVSSRPRHDNDRDPARRLIVGYVPSDFRHHSAAVAFGPVLRNHDKDRFEVVCYSCSL